ncbi:DEAD/DEAH box helicase [Frigidibacter sp. ROC022]|uniref:DEAD/DEAH box helicase n=1 Tax=Frigidibacter sp. ROC022 TaxID=2971796 RepID=UPI00215B218B|nr:DEAD/DEAH box helicase [Frigidibacter sp. ROC022]MCR8724045.1 DEAD/DEAH box helicase [Frigidibacter sp. ROC022]
MSDFKTLGLSDRILARLAEIGHTEPTPIQWKGIPHVFAGRDVMGLAQTGTGKTLAFGLPIIQELSKLHGKPAPGTARALILAPTRELAKQIEASLGVFTKGTPLKTAVVVGGASLRPQAEKMKRGLDILVATPGRLIDHLDRGSISLGQTRFLVLDEADQMLDLGFIHALRRIVKVLPEERQTMLFSATMPKLITEIANSYLQSPIRVEVSPPGKTADKIDQSVHFVAQGEKARLLESYLDQHRDELALVFSRTKHGAEKLKKLLEDWGFAAGSIHGNKSQGQRDRALAAFKAGELRVLVATDVAARGIDIPDVRHVYNYDLPNVPDAYVHRIGRTARAGKDGRAVAFCSPAEMDEFRAIEKTIGNALPVIGGTPWVGSQIEKPVQNQRRRSGGGFKSGGFRAGGGKGSNGSAKPKARHRQRRRSSVGAA